MDFEKLKENSILVTKTPLPGYNLTNILVILAQNKFRFSLRYFNRMVYTLFLSSIIAPFRIRERIKYDKKINNTEIKNHPLFIIGHWRNGTTYLHNVLSLDKNLGYFTTFHAYLPSVFLSSEKLLKSIVAKSLPKKRPMDDAIMDADLPQEDQYAIGAFSPYSYYHGWCFPKNMDFYNNYVLMENVSQDVIDKWKEVYLYLLKKATLYNNGKRLVLKNQDNTAKIKILLEMFPDAKFILILRNPYQMYYSMMKFMRIVIPLYCVQNPPKFEIVEKSMMDLYAKFFRKYLDQRDSIPKGNLVEIKYENFINNPLKMLKKIYTSLNLEGFKESENSFREYVETQKSFKPQTYEVSDDVRKKIDEKWGFVVEEFGYK